MSVMHKINIQTRQDKWISLAILLSFPVITIQILILLYLDILGTDLSKNIETFSKLFTGLFFLIIIPIIIKRSFLFSLITYSIAILIFMLNLILFPDNHQSLLSVVFPLFFICLPSFIYSYSIKNKKILLEIMNKTSHIVLVFGILLATLVLMGTVNLEGYNMGLAYTMLLPSIVSLYKFLEFRKFLSLLEAIAAILIILLLGSRGPLLCIGIYIILYLITTMKTRSFKYITSLILLLPIITTFILFYEKILIFLFEKFYSLGWRSRTLYLLLQEDINLSGRDELYRTILSLIKENPLIGIGIAGDRVYLGIYTHNIILEIISGFGIVIGSLIILSIILITFLGVYRTGKLSLDLLVIWFCIGVAPLFISGSYLISFNFWIYMGLALNLLMTNNKFNKQNDIDKKIKVI